MNAFQQKVQISRVMRLLIIAAHNVNLVLQIHKPVAIVT